MRIPSFIFCLFVVCFAHAQRIESPFCKSSRFESFISSFENKEKNIHTLRSLFNKAHRKFLKEYSAYTQPENLIETNRFDCLSGTYFLATSLEHLGFKFKIIETNYHIFMIVDTEQGQVLLESTDRYHGFVFGESEIKSRIKQYENLETAGDKHLYLSSFHLFHEVFASQLPGLLFFNQAVESFHKKDWKSSYAYLEKARRIYENPRIDEFTPILIRSILSSDLRSNEKIEMITVLREHQQNNFARTLASR